MTPTYVHIRFVPLALKMLPNVLMFIFVLPVHSQLRNFDTQNYVFLFFIIVFYFKDYICRENSRQVAIIDYLFSVYFHKSIFSLLDICCENLCMETYLLKMRK